jgi:excisionase family DNA binding protein
MPKETRRLPASGRSRQNPPLPKFYTIKAIAESLDVSPRTVSRWIDSGALTSHELGHSVRIAEDDLHIFLVKRRGS